METAPVVENSKEPTPWITGNGNFNLETAPDEIKGVVSKKGWKDVGSVVKSYAELEKHVGSKFNLPDELDDTMRGTIYKKLGKPETKEGYEFKLPEGINAPQEVLAKFADFAYSKHLPKAVAQELLDFEMEVSKQAVEAQSLAAQKQMEDVAKQLKEEWKENYDTNFKQAKSTAEKLDVLADLEEIGLADHPKVIKILHKLNKQLSEDSIAPKKLASAPEPKMELEELMKSEAFLKRMHPDHKKAHQRFLELNGIAG